MHEHFAGDESVAENKESDRSTQNCQQHRQSIEGRRYGVDCSPTINSHVDDIHNLKLSNMQLRFI